MRLDENPDFKIPQKNRSSIRSFDFEQEQEQPEEQPEVQEIEIEDVKEKSMEEIVTTPVAKRTRGKRNKK